MFVHFPVVQVGKGSVVVRSNIDVLLSSFFFFPLVVKKSIWVTLNYQGMYIGAGSFFWGGGVDRVPRYVPLQGMSITSCK